MARLLPPYVDKNCRSSGERLLFDIFKHSRFSEHWIVLHSLNLSRHTKRLYGEIDFLILIPGGGIYVMEVKGGSVKCVDGIWQFIDRFNNVYSSSIGPFNQARDAMFSLRSAVEREFGKGHKLTRLLYGFLCAFPHISFDKHSVEYEPWQILDHDVIHNDVEGFFQGLIRHSIQKHRGQKWFSQEDSLPTGNDLDSLCDFLRGDFERIRSIKERLTEFNAQAIAYTEEQFGILDSIELNERSVTQGSAGTGKTMIAIESAIRAAARGEKVFLTCFNRLIGDWMKKQVSEWEDNITASSLHNYLINESKGFDYDQRQKSRQDFYTRYLPGLLRDFFQKAIIRKYDRLIIDEGQDLIREDYMRLFDSMITGGLANGRWEIYGDFEKQAIYAQFSKEQMFSLISRKGQPTKFKLRTNCRNTRQIGEETSLISGFESTPYLLSNLEGIPVEYVFYADKEEARRKLVEKLETALKTLPPSELTIISPKRLEKSCCSHLRNNRVQEIRDASDISPLQGFYGFATVQSFKGMESNYVVITDIEDLTSELAKSLLYVGMTRARYGLILFITESMRKDYEEILRRRLS